MGRGVQHALLGSMLVIFSLALILFAGALLNHAISPDLPWLMLTGEWILEHHQLPRGDLFSWTAHGKPWVLYQWLFEVAIAGKSILYGLPLLVRGFIVQMLLVYLGSAWWVARRHKVPVLVWLAVGTMALLILPINLALRPMAVTSVFLALQWLWVRGYWRLSRRGLLIVMAAMYVLWANMHTGVVLGLVSLALFALGDLLEGRLRGVTVTGLSVKSQWGLLLWALAWSAVNPYGLGIYAYLWELSQQSSMNHAIEELLSPNFHLFSYQVFLAMVAVMALTGRAGTQATSWAERLHLLVFTTATFVVQRFVVWAVLIYLLTLPKALTALLKSKANWRLCDRILATRFPKRIKPWALGLMVLLVAGFVWNPWQLSTLTVHGGRCESLKPGLTYYAQSLRRPTDRIFHDGEMGSCLLEAAPKIPVFIDTRFDFYGSDRMQEARQVVRLRQDPEPVFKRWGVTTILVRRGAPLAVYLEHSPGVTREYADKALAIFRRP